MNSPDTSTDAGPSPAPAVTCSVCGRRRGDDPAEALLWTIDRDGGRDRHVCPPCTREHVRAIEAKLDQHWW